MSVKNCPLCNQPLKVIPAGISKGNGKPYPAFYACPNKCNLRGKMDTRVEVQTPEGWDDLGQKLGVKKDIPIIEDKNFLIEINVKLDKILEILIREMPE